MKKEKRERKIRRAGNRAYNDVIRGTMPSARNSHTEYKADKAKKAARKKAKKKYPKPAPKPVSRARRATSGGRASSARPVSPNRSAGYSRWTSRYKK